ncbi:MAG: hypothetical protein JNK49_11520 [Planctomycetes bacterium]|nr:hypothetical protein [Planctomycetota bacterium]
MAAPAQSPALPARRAWFGRVLLLANLLAANGAAAWWVLGCLRPSLAGLDPIPFLAAAGGERLLVLPLDRGPALLSCAAAVLLLLANFAWLVRRPDRRPPANWVLSDTPTGPVRIAREALEAGLQRAAEGLPEITRLRVQVDTSGQKRIVVLGVFQCAEGTSNLAASQRLRQALHDRLGAMVRPADGVRIEVELEFSGFSGKLGKRAGEVPPPDDGVPFTGPKYPIDDDSHDGQP